MTPPLTVETERVDDIPVLLAHMQHMGLPALLDHHFPMHGNWEGLSLGSVVSVWLAYILSRGDHRLSHVEPWVASRRHTLSRLVSLSDDEAISELDWADDRLAGVLRRLSEERAWQAFEEALAGRLVRVYALEAETVRLDMTSASGYWGITEDGLFQFGHSKDHRPDLPQVKVALSTLDPLGLPLATDVVAGNRADDPLYGPSIERVRKALSRRGLLYVGDCKMAALDTRVLLVGGGDHYLCPLAKTPGTQAQLSAYLASAAAQAPMTITDAAGKAVAEAFECHEMMIHETPTGEPLTWVERRLVVRSHTQAEAARRQLHAHLAAAETALARLGERGRGKAKDADRAAFEARVAAILKRHQVADLLRVACTEEIDPRTIRAYGDRPMRIQWRRRFSVTVERDEAAVEARLAAVAWRVFVTNHAEMTLEQAVWAYRGQFVIERGFARLKGQPLSLTPMYLQRDDHATGLIRLLSLGLRVLILLEFGVRRQLAQEQATLAGLYAGNPRRSTARPTAELLLEVFREVTLTVVVVAGVRHYHLTALTALQKRILSLSGFAAELYTGLCTESVKPP